MGLLGMVVRVVAALGVLFATACGSGADGGGESACGAQRAAIYNGSSDPAPLDLGPEQRSAIVALRRSGGPVICTGTMLSARWALSAAHCNGPELEVQAEQQTPRRLLRTVTHPELDVMLGELASVGETTDGVVPITPIAPWPSAIDEGWIGLEATLAGFGMTESREMGRLFFVREPVVAVEATEIRVDGRGKTGACAGDSGGPLLVADDSGQARIAGVLDRGSADCLGVDLYTRMDLLAAWIESTVRPNGVGIAEGCFRETF